MRLTLFISPGSCARVPLIALEEIGAPFETRLVRFMKGDHRAPDYLRMNPAGKVPLLVVDGEPLAQNVAILSFLANAFPETELLPPATGALADAQMLSMLAWCASDLHQLVTRIRLPMMSSDEQDSWPSIRSKAASTMALQLAPVEAKLAGQPWLLGERWSVVDAYIAWIWFRITDGGFPSEGFPNLARHSRRIEERPAVQRALAREVAAQRQLEEAGLAFKIPPMPAMQLSA
jgi:glutathione S-transferase